MNKKLISLALGMAIAGFTSSVYADSANVEIYGAVEASVNSEDVDGGNDDVVLDGNGLGGNGGNGDAPGGATNTSILGVRGSEDLGNGLKAIWQVEFGLDIQNAGGVGGRDQWVGLEGNFGQLTFGTVMTSYKESGAMIDPFDSTALQAPVHGTMSRLHHDDLSGRSGEGRATNTLKYVSPSFNGLTGQFHWTVGSENDGTGNEDDGAYGLGLHYMNGNILAFFDYIDGDVETGGEDTAWKLGGKYTMGNLAFFGQYENDGGLLSDGTTGTQTTTNTTDGGDIWMLGGTFTLGNTDISLAYGQAGESDNQAGVDQNDDYDVVQLGAIHNLSMRTRAYLGYSETEGDTNGRQLQFWTVGLRHTF